MVETTRGRNDKGAKSLVGAKRLGGERQGGKRLGGKTTRGGNGLGRNDPDSSRIPGGKTPWLKV